MEPIEALKLVLAQSGVTSVAVSLGVSRNTIYTWLKGHGRIKQHAADIALLVENKPRETVMALPIQNWKEEAIRLRVENDRLLKIIENLTKKG